MSVDLRLGDCLDVLRTLDDESIDAIVTDPPYGLEFMGRNWDGQVPGMAYWRECLRVAKPGSYVAAFGGTRTYHRLAVAIEDAGFEIRDSIGLAAWVQGQGFPKSKSQLKPAWEPIILARKPFKGSAAANVMEHGTGALNIDATRVGMSEDDRKATTRSGVYGETTPGTVGFTKTAMRTPINESGRWPANVVLVHAESCRPPGVCDESCPVREMDRQSGQGKSTPYVWQQHHKPGPKSAMNASQDGSFRTPPNGGYSDSGGASRFFPVFKYQAKAPASERPKIDGKGWPTVKPLALMRWLVRLVTPPGGLVLDPFAGTGPTLQAAEIEGFHALGVERDEFAYRLACVRLGREDPEAVA